MNQEAKILRHLQKVGDISGVEAWDLYRVRSLPRRIATLREQGHEIKSVPKRDITQQRYVRYVYEGAKEDAQ